MAWLSEWCTGMNKKMSLHPSRHRAWRREHRLHFSPRGICVTYNLTTIHGEPAVPHDSLTTSAQLQGLWMTMSLKTTACYTRLLKPRNNFELQFLEMVFHFFSNPTKQVVLQTENGNQLPATQKRMTKHTQYDILYVKKKGSAPSTGDKCSKKSINIVSQRRMS